MKNNRRNRKKLIMAVHQWDTIVGTGAKKLTQKQARMSIHRSNRLDRKWLNDKRTRQQRMKEAGISARTRNNPRFNIPRFDPHLAQKVTADVRTLLANKIQAVKTLRHR